jgi:hypothetical protein
MGEVEVRQGVSLADFLPFAERHYKELWRRQLTRLLLMYLGPLLVAIVHFTVQYNQVASDSRRILLQEIAGSQANTLSICF